MSNPQPDPDTGILKYEPPPAQPTRPEPELVIMIPIACTIECCQRCRRVPLNDRERAKCPKCWFEPPIAFGNAEWVSRSKFGRMGIPRAWLIDRLGLTRRPVPAPVPEE